MMSLLFFLSLFLFSFIPLFPKLPLFDAIPGYIVRVRPEDVLVFLTGCVWVFGVIKRRIKVDTSYFKLACLYAIAGMLSLVTGIFFLRTIPFGMLHIGKSGLHLLRYLEYFSLFFFFFSSLKGKRQVYVSLFVLVLTILGVVGYGLGQKYAHFPVYSTMNREYSKGETLYLEQGARLQSTFAGHYDLAAYLVIVLPIILSLALGNLSFPLRLRQSAVSLGLFLVAASGIAILVISGSKISILGFGLAFVLILYLYWRRLASRSLKMMSALLFIVVVAVGTPISWMALPASIKTKITSKLPFLNQNVKSRPTDLVGDGMEDKIIATANPDGTTKYKTIRVASTYSPNALKYGLSMGIRLDTLWPQALLGFARSPLTGSGYGTLAMLDSGLFQEADSTDNNYLRVIGETGIFGFLTFFGFIILIYRHLMGLAREKDKLTYSLSIGFAGSILGLLISAVYLDVFAASKVAFTFWAIAGLVLKSSELSGYREISLAPLWKHLRAFLPLYGAIIVGVLFLYQNPFLRQSVTKDIDQYTLGIEELTRARCFLSTGHFNLCRNSGLVMPSMATPYTLLMIPFLSLFKNVGAFAYLNVSIMFIIIIGSFAYLSKRKNNREETFFVLLMLIFIFSLLRLSWMPLTSLQMIAVIVGSVLLVPFLARKSQAIEKKNRVLVLIVLGSIVFFVSRPSFRFRNLSPNMSFTTFQLANGTVKPTPTGRAYLISSVNPYFADLYVSDKYSLLPLSESQPYGKQLASVWGVPQSPSLPSLYDSLLDNRENLFVSDYNALPGMRYNDSFRTLKEKYSLEYIALGCDERCNVYTLTKARPNVSPNVQAILNGRVLEPQKLSSHYKFSLVSYRFDKVSTQTLINELVPRISKPEDFQIITGDFIHSPEPVFVTLFANNYSSKAAFPVLYSAGNVDLNEHKYYPGGHVYFFTTTDFYILLDADKNSQWGSVEQLAFYNDLLQLEKLPAIKNVFIISHDLNWQNTQDPKNALHVIERKMAEFPNVHTYIITANHSGEGFVRVDKKDKITYVASLARGNAQDQILEIQVNNGEATIAPEKLLP